MTLEVLLLSMASTGVSASSTRTRVSTGYGRLDEALQGGFLAGSAIVLSAPASDETPRLVRSFLMPTQGEGLLLSRSLSAAQAISNAESENLKCLVCSDKPVPPAKNIIPGRGIENLTELNLQIIDAVNFTQPKRVAVDILSDILLRHKALQTRKWLNELLERLRAKGVTTLAVINPNMHSKEEAEAVLDVFEGNLEIIEKDLEGTLRKFMRIKWMHGVEVTEKEFPLEGLNQETTQVPVEIPQPVAVFKEPRWLAPLVGKSEELTKLKSAFDDAMKGRSLMVALEGEGGSGKTRLAAELAVYAQKKQPAVLRGRASDDKLPYAPWVGVCREYIGRVPGEWLRKMLGTSLPEFARLVPDIAAKVGTIPPSSPLGEQQDRVRLFEAVTRFLIAVSHQASGLLIILDDMHWADQASIDLLEYFVRGAGDSRVLVVCCYGSEAGPDAPLYKVLMKLNKDRLLETVPVKNLSEEETGELMEQIFGERTVSAEFVNLTHQRTGGNPFFVEEVLRALVEDGTVFKTEKGWDRKPVHELSVPKSVKTALKSRLAKLDPDTLNILQWAAVMGSEFDYAVLQEVSQVNEETLIQKLEQLISLNLVSEIPHQRSKFRFADDRIRELLLDDLIQIKRARYHLKLAEAIEKVSSKNLGEKVELLALHFSESGDTERTVKYSVLAGDRNRAIHAYESAVKNYKRALELLELEGGKELEKAEMLEKLGAVYYSTGKLTESTNCFQRALGIYEKAKDRKGAARVCVGMANTMSRATASPESTKMLMRGLEDLEGELEGSEAASIYAILADYHSSFDNYQEANMWADKAIRVGEKASNFRAFSTALQIKGAYLADIGRIDEALPLFERALNVALEHDENDEAIFTLLNLSNYTYPRDLKKALEEAVRIIELGKRTGEIMGEARGWGMVSHLNWLKGDWNAAEEAFRNGKRIAEQVEMKTMGVTDGARILLLLSRGDIEDADKLVQSALAATKTWPKITVIVLSHLAVGLVRMEQGKDVEARTHFEACVNAFRDWEFTTMPLLHIEVLMNLGRIQIAQGELEKARENVDWAKRLAMTVRSEAGQALASQGEAALLLALGDRERAEKSYLESLTMWQKADWPYYHAKALVAYSDAIAQTNPEESHKRLDQAAEVFRNLGAKRDLEKAQAKLVNM